MISEAVRAKTAIKRGVAQRTDPGSRKNNAAGGGTHAVVRLRRRVIALLLVADILPFAGLAGGVLTAGIALALTSVAIVVGVRYLTTRIDRAVAERDALLSGLARSSRLAAVGELATGLAHEINNPLAILSFEHSNIEDDLAPLPIDQETRERLVEAIERCKRQIDRCSAITRKLLQFCSVGDNEPQPTVVAPVIKDLVSLMRSAAQKRRINIDVSCADDLPPALLDASELEQVLMNLLKNALDASQDNDRIQVSACAAGDKVEMVVRDHGCGMTAGVIERAFEPFFTTKPVGLGTGLGLSVCYGIVSGWGGTIDIESSQTGGTAVTVRVPTAQSAKSAIAGTKNL